KGWLSGVGKSPLTVTLVAEQPVITRVSSRAMSRVGVFITVCLTARYTSTGEWPQRAKQTPHGLLPGVPVNPTSFLTHRIFQELWSADIGEPDKGATVTVAQFAHQCSKARGGLLVATGNEKVYRKAHGMNA